MTIDEALEELKRAPWGRLCIRDDGEGPMLEWHGPEGEGPAEEDAPATLAAWYSAKAWAALRAERTRRITACDWRMLPDSPGDKTAWAAYRQALRDLPENTADPASPTWPTPPT